MPIGRLDMGLSGSGPRGAPTRLLWVAGSDRTAVNSFIYALVFALAAVFLQGPALAAGQGEIPPRNDSFAAPGVITGSLPPLPLQVPQPPGLRPAVFFKGGFFGATKEPGEPDHAGQTGGHSVWYRWRADRDGRIFMQTHSALDTVLAVYTGDTLEALTEIVSNDDNLQFGRQASVTFEARAGTVYRIAVDLNGSLPSQFSRVTDRYNQTFGGAMSVRLPARIIRNDLVVATSEEPGLWLIPNEGDAEKIFDSSASKLLSADVDGSGTDDLIADLDGNGGIWAWLNGRSWVQVATASARHLAAGDLDDNGVDDLVIDFGPSIGVWALFELTNWRRVADQTAKALAVGDLDNNGVADIVLSFEDGGTWGLLNGENWVKQNEIAASHIAVGNIDFNPDADLVLDLPPHGIWAKLNNGGWPRLTFESADHLVLAGIYGHPASIVTALGGGLGIKAIRHGFDFRSPFDFNPSNIDSRSPKLVAIAELPGGGDDDLLVDFGEGVGLERYQLHGNWRTVFNKATRAVTAGNFDGVGPTARANRYGDSFLAKIQREGMARLGIRLLIPGATDAKLDDQALVMAMDFASAAAIQRLEAEMRQVSKTSIEISARSPDEVRANVDADTLAYLLDSTLVWYLYDPFAPAPPPAG